MQYSTQMFKIYKIVVRYIGLRIFFNELAGIGICNVIYGFKTIIACC